MFYSCKTLFFGKKMRAKRIGVKYCLMIGSSDLIHGFKKRIAITNYSKQGPKNHKYWIMEKDSNFARWGPFGCLQGHIRCLQGPTKSLEANKLWHKVKFISIPINLKELLHKKISHKEFSFKYHFLKTNFDRKSILHVIFS